MQIQYEIVAFHPSTGSVEVRYFCTEFPSGLVYTVDVPVENGQIVSQDKVEQMILAVAPKSMLQRMIELQAAEIPAFLADKVYTPPVTPTDVPADVPSDQASGE